VSWSHHWVWILPAALYLWQRGKWMLAATTVFAIGPHAFLDPEGRDWFWPEQLLGSSYVLLGLAFLITAALAAPQALNSEARIRYTWRFRS